ncbi:hypothetical protein ACNZ61_002115 [Enterococcus hirae]
MNQLVCVLFGGFVDWLAGKCLKLLVILEKMENKEMEEAECIYF